MFRAGKGNHVHYCCRYSTKLPDLPCYGLSIRAKEMEETIYFSVKNHLVLYLGDDEENQNASFQFQQLTAYEARLRNLQTKKRHLYEQFISGGMDYEQMEAEKKSLDNELALVTDSLTVLREMEKKHQGDAQVKQTFQAMLQEISEADHLTSTVTNRLIDKVYIFHDKRIEIRYKMQDFFGPNLCANRTQLTS